MFIADDSFTVKAVKIVFLYISCRMNIQSDRSPLTAIFFPSHTLLYRPFDFRLPMRVFRWTCTMPLLTLFTLLATPIFYCSVNRNWDEGSATLSISVYHFLYWRIEVDWCVRWVLRFNASSCFKLEIRSCF